MKRISRFALVLAFLFLVAVTVPSWIVGHAAEGRCFDSVTDIPARRVGVVLGTSKYIPGGGPNQHYRNRMDGAAKLFHAGKVEYLLLSGDNSTKEYNEPAMMRKDLIERGVPEDRLVPDYAGVRTLDSVVRAGEVFGLREFTVISQRFHNERAIYIARHRDLDVIGFDAEDVSFWHRVRSMIRERFARIQAVLDVTNLNRQPRFSGERAQIGPGARRGSGEEGNAAPGEK